MLPELIFKLLVIDDCDILRSHVDISRIISGKMTCREVEMSLPHLYLLCVQITNNSNLQF